MLIIGITGSFGTGKTTVANIFTRLGAKVLDADVIAHKLLEPNGVCFKPVVRCFGEDIVSKGRIKKKQLSSVVFKNPKALKKLCNIIHPAVIKDIKKKISHYRKMGNIKAIIIDAPLLIEAGLHKIVDYLIVVKANRKLQIKRVLKRMPINKSQIMSRIKAQMGINEKIRLSDIVIDNRGDLRQTKKQVEEIWLRLLKRRRKK